MRSRVTVALVAVVSLGAAFGAGTLLGGNNSKEVTKAGAPHTRSSENAVHTDKRLAVDAEQGFEPARSDFKSRITTPTFRPDPELQRGRQHAIELNELICRETGQNCEATRLAQRQYQQIYGSR